MLHYKSLRKCHWVIYSNALDTKKRQDKTRETVVQEEESNNNYMSDDSLASSNDSENQVSRKMVKDNFW